MSGNRLEFRDRNKRDCQRAQPGRGAEVGFQEPRAWARRRAALRRSSAGVALRRRS